MSDYGKILMSTANAVGASLKKKMGSLTGFAPVDWAETINKLGNKLPERTVSGAVCSFSDGADDVPIKTATFNIDPTLDGVSEVNVVRSGKNLFDEDNLIIEPIPYTSMIFSKSLYLPVGTYKASISNIKNATSWRFGFRAFSADGNIIIKAITNNYISMNLDLSDNYSSGTTMLERTNGTTTNITINILKPCYLVCCISSGDVGSSTTVNYQIEKGADVTTYEPYTATTRTISLGQTVYGGSVTVDEDGECELSDGYKRVDMGMLNYTYVPAYQYFYAEISDKKEGMTNVKADGYTKKTVAFDGTQSDLTIKGGASNHRVFLTNRTYTDPNTLKTALSGVYLVYEKNTPTESYLDPITPINTLLGTNNLWANTGDSEVTYYAQPNVPEEVLYKGQISTTSDYATANFTESVEDDVDILVKVYCPARSAVDYKVIKVADIGNGLNVGFSLHTTVNCTITKTSIASYQYSGDYYDIYADVLAYDSAIFN